MVPICLTAGKPAGAAYWCTTMCEPSHHHRQRSHRRNPGRPNRFAVITFRPNKTISTPQDRRIAPLMQDIDCDETGARLRIVNHWGNEQQIMENDTCQKTQINLEVRMSNYRWGQSKWPHEKRALRCSFGVSACLKMFRQLEREATIRHVTEPWPNFE